MRTKPTHTTQPSHCEELATRQSQSLPFREGGTSLRVTDRFILTQGHRKKGSLRGELAEEQTERVARLKRSTRLKTRKDQLHANLSVFATQIHLPSQEGFTLSVARKLAPPSSGGRLIAVSFRFCTAVSKINQNLLYQTKQS